MLLLIRPRTRLRAVKKRERPKAMGLTAVAYVLMGLAYMILAIIATRWGVREFMAVGFIKVFREILFFFSVLMAVLHVLSRLGQLMKDKNSQQ